MTQAIIVDFLYLDLSVCARCQGTESALMTALETLSQEWRQEGISIRLNKINVTRAELAIKTRFVSSPTIRVNGRDIADTLMENVCQDCGSLCGDQVTCRVWTYHGETLTTPPVELLKELILKSLEDSSSIESKPYVMPENLKVYYDGLSHKDQGPTITLKHL